MKTLLLIVGAWFVLSMLATWGWILLSVCWESDA